MFLKRYADKFRYYLTSMKRKGGVELVRQMFWDYYYNKKIGGYNFIAVPDNGIVDSYEATDEVIGKSVAGDGYRNTPSSSYYIFRCFKFIPFSSKEVTLLDIGCGHGKVLVMGIYKGFKKVYGIDLDSEGLKAAADNCRKAQAQFGNSEFEVIRADAAEYPIPADVNVVFLYNPFGQDTVKRVLANIEASYFTAKRPIFILYYSPVWRSEIEQNPLFAKVYDNRLGNGIVDFSIYRVG